MLPEQDWLPQAKRLAVGMRVRVHHKNERRPNMTIGNERDRYWAYCQSCKEGARLDKEHVLLAYRSPAELQTMQAPTDLIQWQGSEYEMIVARFLASKGMDAVYLPPLFVSPSARRLMLRDDNGNWHGRDLTERSNQKWLHYGVQFVGVVGPHTILTEDLFSMYKLRYALQHCQQIAPELSPGQHIECMYSWVCSTLGSYANPAAVLALKDCAKITWAYDGDAAGDAGYKQASKRMRPFGAKQYRARPPDGLDPKDMACADLITMIRKAYQ